MAQDLKFNDFFINLMLLLYQKVFKREISPNVRKFFENLTKVSIASLLAVVLTFSFNVLAGRFAGPEEYGYYQVLMAIVAIISIPMTLGLATSLLNYNSQEISKEKNSAIMSHIYILILIYTLIATSIYLIFLNSFSSLFHVPSYLFFLAIIFAIIFTFYAIMNNTLTSLHEMGKYASYQVLIGFIMVFGLLVLFYFGRFSFTSMVVSISIAYSTLIILVLIRYYRYIKFKLKKDLTKKLVKYGLYSAVGGVACALYGGVDLLFINYFINASSAGIYSVYKYASLGLGGMLFAIFNTVFFPSVTRIQNKRKVLKDINAVLPYIFLLGVPLAFVAEFVILKIYGNSYPFDVGLALLFSVLFFLIITNNIYVWLMSAVGVNGAKISSFSAVLLAIFNIILNWFLIPALGLFGGVISLIISYIVAISFLYLKRDIYVDKK